MQVVALPAGTYEVTLEQWKENGVDHYSAWKTTIKDNWMHMFSWSIWNGFEINPKTTTVVQNGRYYATPREAFDAFPKGAMMPLMQVPWIEWGRPTSVALWVATDNYNESGELRIRLTQRV